VAAKQNERSGDVLFTLESALKKNNVCLLLGPRRIGKTTVLKELLEEHSANALGIHIDAHKISLTPENFSIEFVGAVLWGSQHKSLVGMPPFSLHHLLKKEKELNQDALEHINAINNELQKIKPDHALLLKHAFAFPDAIAKQHKKNLIVAIDNAEQLLELKNFGAIESVSGYFNNTSTKYVLASAAGSEMSAEFSGAQVVGMGMFEEKHALEMVKREWQTVDKKLFDEMYSLSSGHPLVLSVLSKKAKGQKHVAKVFYSELLKTDGELYTHCADAIEYALSRARGRTLPKVILKVVANDNLRLSEIARLIYRSAPVTKSLIDRLIAVDLLKKEGKTFLFSDPLLGLWVKLLSRGFECTEDLSDEQLLEVMRHA
jgi:ABC-type cobalamin/Fe3+-siderophores transport system ATPase subunit